MENVYSQPIPVASASAEVRAQFIRRTYLHLAGAILVFAALESILLSMDWSRNLAGSLLTTGRMGWLMVLGGFMITSWVADRWARSSTSSGMQYAGLGLYVLAQAVIFLPILLYASDRQPSAIANAALVTIIIFLGLTATAFITKKDFSFLRGILAIGFFLALGLIIASAFIPFGLGTIFMIGMVVLAAGSILYSTSNVIHHYQPHQHVAAALSLFAGIALLFWYILQLFLARD